MRTVNLKKKNRDPIEQGDTEQNKYYLKHCRQFV